MKKLFYALIVIASGIASLAGSGGCGGSSGSTSTSEGGGSTGVAGLAIAEQMSLVTATADGSSGSISSMGKALRLGKAVPTAGDYVTDEPEIYVFDESMEVMSIINEILCQVDQSRYDKHVNEGDYIALLDDETCMKDRSAEQNDQSSGQATNLSSWIVNSSRADESSPHIVKFWVPGNAEDAEHEGFDEIRAQLTITGAKSDSNPFGIFSLDFAGYLNGARSMTGNLSSVSNDSGQVEFEMVLNGEIGFAEAIHALLSPDGSTGRAYATRQNEVEDETVQVAFDADHYLTNFGDRTQCRDRLNFRNNVWEYNLYNANGARVDRDSGESLRYGDNYGWADNFGVWLGDGVTPTTGLEVEAEDGSATYTVFRGGGRLIKRTKGTTTLGELLGDTFQLWEQDSGRSFLTEWNGTNLVKTGLHECDQTGCIVTDIDDVNLAVKANQWIGLWKQGLGSLDILVPENGILTNALEVPLYTETFLTPSSPELAAGLTLKCYSECPVAPMTTALLEAGTPFLPNIEDNKTTPYTYTISAADMTLMKGGEAITMEDGAAISASSPNFWGFHSGPMVPTSVTITDYWKVWSQDVSYNYESGPNQWNKYTGLLDANGDARTYEPALNCIYKDEENGTYMLNYHGEGRLFGIPFEKIEGEGDFEHWIAQFVIPDGSELVCDGAAYYTKAMSIEQNMIEDDASACADLAVGDISAPTNTFTDHEMGEAPTVTDAPKVTP